MTPFEQKYLEITKNYFKWMDDVKKFEDEMNFFEDESSDFQSKLDILFREFAAETSVPSALSVSSGIDNTMFMNFISASTKFTRNITEYFDKKIKYEELCTEYCNKLVESQKAVHSDDYEGLVKSFLSVENLYVPELNKQIDDFRIILADLRREYNSLKSEYSKFIQ